jgi:DNA ligase-1
MRQAYRKEDVDVSRAYMMLFDFLPLGEWKSGNAVMTCTQRYDMLVQRVMGLFEASQLKHVGVVERQIVPASYPIIKELHDKCVSEGHEGVMIKDLDAPYRFGRGYEVMKLKDFHDADVKIIRVEEGTGKFKGMCGSLVVDYKGIEVGVGSGLDDQLRHEIWKSPEMFAGRTIEVRYQEVTPDGSLRFPIFICFRNDRG